MDKDLTIISEFIKSAQNIFILTPIDYPTLLQQHLINCYFFLKDILQNSHSEIIKTIHTANDRDLQFFIVGIQYMMLLKPDNYHSYLKYTQTMKSQGWQVFSRYLKRILTQCFDTLRQQSKIGIGHIYRQAIDHQCIDENITTMIIKTIDPYSMTQNNLTYTNYMMNTFQSILEKGVNAQFAPTHLRSLAQCLFVKIIRLISILYLLQDQAIQQLKNSCKGLLMLIWAHFGKQCLVSVHQVLRLCQQLEKFPEYTSLLSNIKSQADDSVSVDWIKQLIVSVLLPIRVQTTLLFIKNEKINSQVAWLQLSWMWKQQYRKGQNCQMILADMTRWVTVSTTLVSQKVYILSWIFFTAQENYTFLQYVKQALFLQWFQSNQDSSCLATSLHFISYSLASDVKIAENLLIYLLLHKNKQFYQNRIRQAILQADKSDILKISSLLQNNFLSQQVKMQITKLLNNTNTDLTIATPFFYDPSESQDQIDYEEYAPNQENTTADSTKICLYKLPFEEQFVEDINPQLITVLSQPNSKNYHNLIKKVIEIAKQYKRGNQNHAIEIITKQTAKLIFTLYNSHFISFQQKGQQFNVLNELIKVIISEIRLNTFKCQMHKKIIKKTIQLFPISQLSFWKVFLQFHKRGAGASNKQFADWLISKDKQKKILSMLQIFMGSKVKFIYQNAASYSLYPQ